MALGRPARGLPRYYMDCGWYRHPRFAGLPVEALFVFEAAVGYSTEHATDGLMPAHPEDLAAALGLRASVVKKALPKLLDRHALERHGDQLRVRGWADHNPTAAEVEARQAERSRSGKRGNHERWHVGKGVVDPSCEFCDSSPDRSEHRSSDRNSDPHPIADSSHGMGWDGMGESSTQPPPTHVGTRPTPGGGDVIDQAARLLAEHETARRGAEIGNPSGYIRARIAPLRREHEPLWRRLLEADPAMTAELLAAAVTAPPAAQVVGESRPLPPVFRAPENTAPTIDLDAVRALRDRLPSHRHDPQESA